MMGLAWIPLVMTLAIPGAPTQTHTLDAHAVQELRAGHQVELRSAIMKPWWQGYMREVSGPEGDMVAAMFASPEAQGQGDIIFAAGSNATGVHVLPGNPFVSGPAYDAVFNHSPSDMYVMVVERKAGTYRTVRIDHPIFPDRHLVMLDVSMMSARMDHGQVVVRCFRSYSPPGTQAIQSNFPTSLVLDVRHTIDGATRDKASVAWSPAFGGGQCSLTPQVP